MSATGLGQQPSSPSPICSCFVPLCPKTEGKFHLLLPFFCSFRGLLAKNLRLLLTLFTSDDSGHTSHHQQHLNLGARPFSTSVTCGLAKSIAPVRVNPTVRVTWLFFLGSNNAYPFARNLHPRSECVSYACHTLWRQTWASHCVCSIVCFYSFIWSHLPFSVRLRQEMSHSHPSERRQIHCQLKDSAIWMNKREYNNKSGLLHKWVASFIKQLNYTNENWERGEESVDSSAKPRILLLSFWLKRFLQLSSPPHSYFAWALGSFVQ